jgi:two-component system NtrC family sensor kinase
MAGEKVLIIDDSSELRSLLESILPFGGYQAISASSGQDGLDLVAQENPDAILVDLELPDTNGLKVLEELNRRRCDIPTIMMTGYGSEGVAAHALRLGVQGYLIKPFTTEEVLSTIEKALSVGRLHREKEQLATLLDRYSRHFQMLCAISRSMVMSLELDQRLERIVEAGLLITQGEASTLLLWDREQEQLHVVAAQGKSSYDTDYCSSLMGDERLRASLDRGTSVRINAAQATIKLQNGKAVRAILQAPLKLEGQILGLLSVVKRDGQTPFGKHDEMMLGLLADYAAMALEDDLRAAALDTP